MSESSNASQGCIFLCYRRDDAGDAAGRIYDWLAREFPSGAVFKDVDSIPWGVDFSEHLSKVLQGCRVVLVVIGRHWTEARDVLGERRLDDPADYVRIEVETALGRPDLPVIPLLVSGAHMPRWTDLPESLRPLRLRNGTEVRRDPDFVADIGRLVRQLKIVLQNKVEELPHAQAPSVASLVATIPLATETPGNPTSTAAPKSLQDHSGSPQIAGLETITTSEKVWTVSVLIVLGIFLIVVLILVFASHGFR
jgi:hypothetical protein